MDEVRQIPHERPSLISINFSLSLQLPMVWHLLMCMYSVNRESVGTSNVAKTVTSVALIIYAIIFSVLHMKLQTTTAFQLHFGALLIALLIRMYGRFRSTDAGPQGRKVIALFLSSLILGFGCWLLDYHNCDWIKTLSFNPHGHVWWHLLMGYAAYCSVVMLKILETVQGGKQVDIKYRLGLPFACRLKSLMADVESQTKIDDTQSLF